MVIQSCFASCGSLFVADKCCHLGRPGEPIGEHHAVTLLAAVPELNYVEAIRSALAFEMDRDERVMVLGLDVGRLGGVFRATQGLLERFGPDRVVDTPLAEGAIVGASLGLSIAGLLPVPEIQFLGFTHQAFHQIGPQLGRYRYRSRGRYQAQVTIRAPFGGGVRTPEFHADAIEAQFTQTPGVKVVCPAFPDDARGMLLEAIRDPDPVLFLEPQRSANLAGVMGAPLVYLLQNNGYAISTPSARQSAAPALALRAAGYGFPGVLVEGNDLFAVYSATRDAVARARRGEGPTLIESRTYRMGFHNTTDNPREYRDDAETVEKSRLDPITRVARYLEGRGLWSAAAAARARQEIAAEIDEAQRKAMAFPRPSADDVYDHAYSAPPPRVQGQRRETLAAGD